MLGGQSRSLNHGFPTMYQNHMMNWTQPFTIRVALAGLVGLVGAILAFKDGKLVIRLPIQFTSPFIRDNDNNNNFQKPLFVPGLQNLQNNCFLNVVLQALASCFCFQSFLHGVITEFGTEDIIETMPLAVSLASLLEELSSVSAEKVVLTPRKIMLAMSHYIPNFNLTSQQDAAEAFLHLICSLREEFGGCYAPNVGSLAGIFASNNRILTPIQRDWQSEQERWKQHFLGPFDGILSSSLNCESCLSQISINFELFDCLPLSPVLNTSSNIGFRCTLVDCLKQFVVAEHVENYRCSHCWHNAAVKYLSLMEGNEVELKILRRCSDHESCDCRKMPNLEKLPWSNRFSHTLKQLRIARCPRILCIQLKRVHMNAFGDSIKLQGHVSFPLILDVFPFMTTSLGVKIQDVDVQNLPLNLLCDRRSSLPNHHNMQSERSALKFSGTFGAATEEINSDDPIDAGIFSSTNGQTLLNNTLFPCSEGSSESIQLDMQMQPTAKMNVSCSPDSQETCLYRLVSVVEHFGKAGSGHYTVYRCVESSEDASDNQTPLRWFCVSDSQVHDVSEEDVLSCEASMLFYERI
ncbi:PREDICTED: ubiquitin carboxyl-terminal hydrolase 27 [Lupinus angustifolius]|uniref:ubiquitin carboxyl-terminal hydrolase 27 n=1 Tax=Lupinus angustifolius TaxID=3871 RepID=UPI00092F31A9|nr:PREDICTED: ubiquitin carboxyl-terminal hydrolase 27 [Lupinus angustifolius]XP_019462602.1 PREDICTED: ubiquitin carboxyl-terminal hydrolase 27 [Lupinus angustifolius]